MKSLWLKLGVLVFWLSWPALWLYLRFTTRTRLLLVSQGKILVVRGWMSAGKWQLPGGGLHAGENPEDGVRREVKEETGLDLKGVPLRILSREMYRGNGLRFTCQYYAAQLEHTEKPRIKGLEIADATWIDVKKVSADTCGQDVMRAMQLVDVHKKF